MIAAVIPAKNECSRIAKVLQTISKVPVELVILVVNGSTDGTAEAAQALAGGRLKVLVFHESLGIDVPRVIGAKVARACGAEFVLFVDGDMIGDIEGQLIQLTNKSVLNQLDLALCDCYPHLRGRPIAGNYPTSKLIRKVMAHRKRLNKLLGLHQEVGLSTPSHGPHLVSRHLLDAVPMIELAKPPVVMAIARKSGAKIGVGVEIPHLRLGSRAKGPVHTRMVAETLIGDCVEAANVYTGKDRGRVFQGKEYVGYDSSRRFDLTARFLLNLNTMQTSFTYWEVSFDDVPEN